ncbi:MAG: NosD domain-containing protein, partial [Candidatus Odinarchaeota archaeon]
MKRRIITRSLVGIMLILFFTSLIAYISNSTYYNATIAEKNQLIVNNWVEPSINRYPVDDLRWKFPSDLSFDKYSGDAYRWEPPADLYANSYRFDPSSTENDSTESNYSNQDSTTSLDYETSDFIYITGDSDFGPANYNFPGSGTQIDPYRIEGYNITGSSADLIHIEGTTAYFVIYHNLLDGMNGYYQGIFLYNVTNGYIDSNIICNSSAGLSMIFTSHNTIMDNDIYGSDNGMVANASYYNFISSNYIHDNVNDGFVFHGSYNNITGNTFSDNGNFGLYILAYSYNNAVQNNSFINNQAGRLSQAIDDSATSTYVYEYSRAPDNIDPATNWDTIGSGINELLYETLVYYNGELASELEGCLATNWDVSPSGMNYTFYLRSDVIFHDGTPFNAYVMKYSLDRAVIMNDPSGPAWMLSDYILGGPEYTSYPDPNVNHSLEYLAAGGVVVVDDYTLLINLDRGYTPFTQILAYRVGAAVSPKAVVDNRPLDYVTDMSDEDFCMVPLDQWFPDLSGDYTKLGLPVDHDSGISGVVAGSGGYSVNAHDWMMTHAVGTGPYKLVEWTSNSMIMEKNIGWWGAFASDSADEVQILFVSDITDRINHLKLGYADQVQMYVSEVDQIVDEYGQPVIEGTNVYTHPSFTLSFFGYNVHDSLPVEFINESLDSTYNPASNQKYSWGTETAGSNPFSALEFRKAFSYVFDYDSFVQTLKGYEERMEGVIPNGIIGHYELLAENGYIPPYDPATAKTFLENVGWKGTIKLVYNTENSVRQLVCEQLESTIESLNVGIEIEVEGVIWPDYLDYWFNGEIPIPVMAWAPDYADPDNYVKAFLHSSGFFSQITGYSNAALDSLIENATTEQDTSIREDLYQQIEETAASDYCVIYGCQSHLVEVTRDWVTGFAESGSLNPMSNMPNIESISDTGVNWFDHNYYSDWTGPDADQDGIVDDPYTIDGNALNVDLNPVTPFPEFTSIPDDIVFESGTGDVFLTWIATDDNPATYNIGIGVNIIESGTWMSGVPITFNAGQLEGFETPMHYNMTIEVFDEVGHSISDWAIVTVLPSSPWTPHAPIYIDSNADFGPSGYNFPGSGTQSDPYLIEWYNITSSVNALIEIRNTDVYFQISHCLLNGVMIDYYRGIYLYNVRNGNISNNIIQFSSWGIELRSSSNINITGNTVSDCTHYGIFVGSSNDITLNGNTCYDIVYGGIYLSYCSNCLLVVNTCYNIDRNGIILTDSSYCTLIGNTCYSNMEGILPARSSNLIISENTCYGNSNTGIKLGLDVVGQIGANHCTITNNTCYNNYGGIFTRNSANNNITDNNLYGNSQDGIRLYDSSSNILANNTCNDNALGITVLGVSNYNILKNNTCYNNDQYPGYGIFVSQMGVGVPVNNTLDGNTCYDNEKAGIVIWFSDNNILTGNRVYNNERGFWIYDSNDNILKSDNNCYSNNYGIYVEHTSSYNTVTGTSISGNTYHGILLMTDASFNVIEGNFFIDNNPQAYDYGLNNTFSHNYWNDWTTPDSDMDGIVDIPYAIGGTAGNTDPYPLAHFYTSHEPIYIDDNSDFIALGFPGTGILSDPYRIEGYEITNSTTNLIHVQDTTVYFVIRNNLLNGTDGSNDGIVLNNVIYGTVENNIIHSSNNGIYLSYSDNNELIGNTVLENAGYGIYLWTSSYNDLIGNNVTGNDLNGIILASSSDNSLIGNTASGNNHGFELSSSNYNNLEDNTATGNSYIGFIGTGSNYNTLTGNTATGHGNYGFALYSSSFNVLTGNTAGGNTGHGFYVWNAFWGSSHNNTLIENSASGNRDGFFLDGASTNNLTGNTATGNTWGFSLTSSSYNNLTGNIASGNTYHGFYLFSSHSNTLDDNTASGNGNDGFYLDDSDSNSLTGNTASSNGDDGFYVFLARYNKLTGNTASENTEEGFYLYSSSIYNNLTGNTASGNYHGFWIYSCYYNTLTGNTASSNTLYGFYVTSASSNNILTGNTASGNNRGFALQHAVENVLIDNTATGSYDGFYLGNSDNNNLTGNTASGNTNGFYVLASSGNALFDNTATGNSWFSFILHHSLSNYNILSWNTAQGGQYGIAIYDSSHYNTLTNNIAKENEEGFYLYNSGNNSLIENAAYNNTKNGIYLVDSIGNNLTGNYAFNNSFKGIYLYNSSYNGITGNTIYDNGEDGIFLKDSDYNTITNNIVFDNGYGTGTAGASTVYSSKVAGMTIGSGMFIDPSVGNVLTDNYVFNNSINGIYLLGSNETIILNNIIYGNGEDGVFLKDSNYNTITGNALFDNGYGGSTSGSSSTAYSSKVAGMTIGSGMFI